MHISKTERVDSDLKIRIQLFWGILALMIWGCSALCGWSTPIVAVIVLGLIGIACLTIAYAAVHGSRNEPPCSLDIAKFPKIFDAYLTIIPIFGLFIFGVPFIERLFQELEGRHLKQIYEARLALWRIHMTECSVE